MQGLEPVGRLSQQQSDKEMLRSGGVARSDSHSKGSPQEGMDKVSRTFAFDVVWSSGFVFRAAPKGASAEQQVDPAVH